MTELLNPAERTARGIAIQADISGRAVPAPTSLLEESWRDFIFAEVWNEATLDRRARYLIALGACVVTRADDEDFDAFVQGALKGGVLSIVEVREAALHMGPYAGWMRAKALDRAVSRAAVALNLDPGGTVPIRAEPWDPAVRDEEGAAEFLKVMLSPSGPPVVPYLRNIHNFVFGEMWIRRALDERSRRWLTLVGVCDSSTDIPINSHVHAAMASGNCTFDEMNEFVLQFGVHCGWPKASIVQSVVFEMHQKVQAGLSWNG